MNRPHRVRYFAILRSQRGLVEEVVDTAASTPAALYDELRARHGFTLTGASIRVAINDEIVPMHTPLQPGDSVTFIPPISGG